MQIKFQEKISSCQCQVFMHIWEVKIVLIHRRTGSLIIEFSYGVLCVERKPDRKRFRKPFLITNAMI
jgi:hypothetical protein